MAPKRLPILKLNSSGNAVQAVQRALSLSGFYSGAFDGIFGAKTAQAVKAFQTSNRLTSDGVIGANTWTALIKLNTHLERCYCDYYGGGC